MRDTNSLENFEKLDLEQIFYQLCEQIKGTVGINIDFSFKAHMVINNED